MDLLNYATQYDLHISIELTSHISKLLRLFLLRHKCPVQGSFRNEGREEPGQNATLPPTNNTVRVPCRATGTRQVIRAEIGAFSVSILSSWPGRGGWLRWLQELSDRARPGHRSTASIKLVPAQGSHVLGVAFKIMMEKIELWGY